MEIDNLSRVVQGDCLLTREKPIIVGVSGGADSLSLLDLLFHLDYPVVVAHFDHGLRDGSPQDAEFVEKLAMKMKIPVVIGKEELAFRKDTIKGSIEEIAREARYEFLFQQARSMNAQAVAVGHTADDQIETVLMHFLRGAGLSGLKGMFYRSINLMWDSTIPLVRPLLDMWHTETLNYCAQHLLSPREDPSNQDITFFRNRLRHELIPYLENFNPRIKQVLWRSAKVLQGELEIVENSVDNAWQRTIIFCSKDYVSFSLGSMQSLQASLQGAIVRRAVHRLRADLRDVEYEVVERSIQFINHPNRSKRVEITGGLFLTIDKDHLYLGGFDLSYMDEGQPQFPHEQEMQLECPGVTDLPGGWIIETKIIDSISPIDHSLGVRDPMQGSLDWECIQEPLVLRTRHKGDRFEPLGMYGHTQKLSDFFINEQLSRQLRDRWPLVTSGYQIVWIPGFRPAHSVRVQESTRQILVMHLRKK